MKILAIDTSCDETAAAVVEGRRCLSSVIASQITDHQVWGGVVPSVAKRAHEARIDTVIAHALKRARVSSDELSAIAVTLGPGLAIALEVGIATAKKLARDWKLPIVPVNHMAGHLFSPFVQNRNGNPDRPMVFPMMAVLVSGGHTEIVLWRNHLDYEVIGRTVDDAAGEALDKAAKILGFSYPGGPIIERLAHQATEQDRYQFTRPMLRSPSYDMSFSGLKTSLLYQYRSMSADEQANQIAELAQSIQEGIFDTIIRKTNRALKAHPVQALTIGGGVAVNRRFRVLMRRLATRHNLPCITPPFRYLNQDNAAMIGVVGSYLLDAGKIAEEPENLDRMPRWSLPAYITVAQQTIHLKQRTS